nr:probable disease resistance protein At5g66900 [Tanacetum cinerariifolium]
MISKYANKAAVVEAVMELLKAILSENKKTAKFRTLLKRLEKTLRNIEPILYESGRLSKVLDRPENEIQMFIFCVGNGRNLVSECSSIKCWNVYKKIVHVSRLIRLDHELWGFFESELVGNLSPSMRTLMEINSLGDKMDQVLSAVTERAGGFSSSCSVPGLPEVIVGLNYHLQEVKRRLIKDENQVLTVSAPGGQLLSYLRPPLPTNRPWHSGNLRSAPPPLSRDQHTSFDLFKRPLKSSPHPHHHLTSILILSPLPPSCLWHHQS